MRNSTQGDAFIANIINFIPLSDAKVMHLADRMLEEYRGTGIFSSHSLVSQNMVAFFSPYVANFFPSPYNGLNSEELTPCGISWPDIEVLTGAVEGSKKLSLRLADLTYGKFIFTRQRAWIYPTFGSPTRNLFCILPGAVVLLAITYIFSARRKISRRELL